MLKRFPVIRRVSIYLVLSSAAVFGLNNTGYEFEKNYIIYLPIFVGVYILSRFIDSKLGEPAQDNKVLANQAEESVDSKGFGSK